MIPFRLDEVAGAVGGALQGDADIEVTGVTLDSRAVKPGDLFVAVPGEQVDGHDFIADAVNAGAVAVLGQRLDGVPGAVVPETTTALGALATALLARLDDLTVVGLTGSSGKTSTKDLLAQVLGDHAETIAPPGSFNNELGLPLTVLRCTEQTRYLVLEMGARGIGHIAYLCGIATLDVGMVLNVGSAHVGEFGDRDAIALAKSEIVRSLSANGVAVLNADDPRVAAMAGVTAARVVTFGESASADMRISGLTLDERARASFTLSSAGEDAEVNLNLSGEHMAANAAAAAAAAISLGVPLIQAAESLSRAQSQSRWRMEVHETAGGVTVINDAYNANPESMRAALKSLVAMSTPGRTWAVLGEMLELGDESAEAHDSLGRLAVRLDVDKLVAVGEGARAIHLGAAHEGSWGEESTWVPDVDAAVAMLSDQLAPGDVVLIKASRASGLEQVAEALLSGGDDA